jgi:CRP-like cAMP-binding protein
MGSDPPLSATEKLLYLGREAWSQVSVPGALRRLSVAVHHMRERGFQRGAVILREGEPVGSAYALVRGRVRVSRRGVVLGEAEAGSSVGLEAMLSQDARGIGVVAATDVLALQVEADTLLGILEDDFPAVHDVICSASRRLLTLTRQLPGLPFEAGVPFYPPPGRRMNLVERLLFLRTPGGPFERSNLDALAELAGNLTEVPFEAGDVFWRIGERARRECFVVEGSVTCSASRDGVSSHFRVAAGRPLGLLESIAGEPRWYEAAAESPGAVLEQNVEDMIDVFEDNVDVALDYLAWVSRTTLDLIEGALGPGPELLAFFTTFSTPLIPDGRDGRPTSSALVESRRGWQPPAAYSIGGKS